MKFPSLLTVALYLLTAGASSAAELRGDDLSAPPLSPEEQLKRFKVPPGFEVQLVAAEPEIQKPININFDGQGRLWVTGSEMYPWPARTDAVGKPLPDFDKVYEEIANAFGSKGKAPDIVDEGRDTVRILSNFGPDGRAKSVQIFADKLNIPTGIQPLPRVAGAKGDAAIVYSTPTIWRFEDTDGDGGADKREPLYEGFGYLDTHGMSSNYIHWIDGWIYGCHGFRNQSEIKDRNGKVLSMHSGNTYRFKPDGSKIEYFTHGQTNPFGLAFDPMGNLYSADSHSKPIYMLIRGGYYEGIGKQHDGLGFAPRITDDDHGSSAIAGIMYYADDQWPAEFHGNIFNGNPVTRRINRAKLDWNGSTPKATRLEDFLVCDDPWFRPVQVKLGPDGAMYIADFYNPIIGHYELPLNHPKRDRTHGRIWRVVWKGAGVPAAAPDLTQLAPDKLVERLGDSNLEVRRLAAKEVEARFENPAAPEALAVGEALTTAWKSGSPVQQATALWLTGAMENQKPGGFLDEKNILAIIGKREPMILVALLRWLTDSDNFRSTTTRLVTAAASKSENPIVLRALAEFTAAHPELVGLHFALSKTSDTKEDLALTYALRVAVREALLTRDGYGYFILQQLSEAAADRRRLERTAASVSLAVPTPEAADYLLEYMRTTSFSQADADQLKHVVLHLAQARLGDLDVITSADALSLNRRVALATGLEEGARKRNISLSQPLISWVHQGLTQALQSTDAAVLDAGISALKESKMEAKAEPLKKLVQAAGMHGPRRAAALEALMNLPIGTEVAATALADTSSMSLRKKAAELLAPQVSSVDAKTSGAARSALLSNLQTAPWELATVIAGGLAKTDPSAEQLLALVEAGKASPALLRNKAVAGPLGSRSAAIKERAARLTVDLPPEDARLDALIAKRVESFRSGSGDAEKGAQIFTQQCAACHKLKSVGGNIGPNLDGMSARGPHRLLEDILDPNRNVDPAFRQTIIETADGRTLAGSNFRQEGETILLNDAAGAEISVPRAQVKSQQQSRSSLMPPTFEQTLSESDLNHLLAYLLKSDG